MRKKLLLIGKFMFILIIYFHMDGVFAGAAENQAALDKAIKWLEQQQNQDGSWGEDEALRYISTSSVVETLKSSSQYSAAYYSGIAWLENHSAMNVDALSRKIAVLYARGGNLASDIEQLLGAKIDQAQQGWGLSENYYNSPYDTGQALQTLLTIGDTTSRDAAVNYLTGSQLSDGGWSLVNQTTSDYLITANVSHILAEIQNPTSAVTTAKNNAIAFLETAPLTSDSLVLANTALALDKAKANPVVLDGLTAELLSRQNQTDGNWDGVYTTAAVARSLSSLLLLDAPMLMARVSIEDQTLRSILNAQLGKNEFDNIFRSELQDVTSLNLLNTDVTSLSGLQYAANLQSLTIGSGFDTSMFTGMSGITLYVDTNDDGIVDLTVDDFASDLDGDGVNKYEEGLRGTNPDVADTLPDLNVRQNLVARLGDVTITGAWKLVNTYNVKKHPVVISGVPTTNDQKPGVVQIKDVTDKNFKIAYQNWNYLKTSTHGLERVSYLAVESGRYYLLDDGSTWEVGTLNVSGTGVAAHRQFSEAFLEAPVVFIAAQANEGGDVVTAKISNITAAGFDVTLQEQESLMNGHAVTKVGYVAIYKSTSTGSVTIAGKANGYSIFNEQVSSKYTDVANKRFRLYLQEEKSLDSEISHVAENTNVLVFDNKQIFADTTTMIESDTATLRSYEDDFMDLFNMILPAIVEAQKQQAAP